MFHKSEHRQQAAFLIAKQFYYLAVCFRNLSVVIGLFRTSAYFFNLRQIYFFPILNILSDRAEIDTGRTKTLSL